MAEFTQERDREIRSLAQHALDTIYTQSLPHGLTDQEEDYYITLVMQGLIMDEAKDAYGNLKEPKHD